MHGPGGHRPPPPPDAISEDIVQDDGHVTFERPATADDEATAPRSGGMRVGLGNTAHHGRRPPPPHDDHHGPHHGPPGPREMSETMKRTVEDIKTVLTPAQLRTWNTLVGEPVPFNLHHSPEDSFLW